MSHLPHGIILPDEKILVFMPFGSYLYGTDTPESDFDFKGIFLPTKREALLGQIRRRITSRPLKAEGEKNAPGSVEWELLSLHEFLKMALEGQTMALDLLHANPKMWLAFSHAWDGLVANRWRFYTRDLKAFVGYARRQASKYGVKGSRVATARRVVDFLRAQGDIPVSTIIEPLLASGLEHVHATNDPAAPIEILGRRLTYGAKCSHCLGTFEKYLQAYGERAKRAERNENVDWKAMSHAIRTAYEVEMIFMGVGFYLPLPSGFADHLRQIKRGELPFAKVQEELEWRIDALTALSESDATKWRMLPEKPDHSWAEGFLLRQMEGAR